MILYRLQLRPRSPWRTPWQADTLAGMLCWTCARTFGDNALRERLINPALEGEPPFVLSDAFPGNLLPVPLSLRLRPWRPADRKRVKRACYVRREAFARMLCDESIDLSELLPGDAIGDRLRTHNAIDRGTGTTSPAGQLFSIPEFFLGNGRADYLSVYVRLADGFESCFLDLIHALSDIGFGADVSTGAGSFEVASELEPADDLAAASVNHNGVIVLSTFHPGPNDPTDGLWDAFPKYGKLGPDFGLENVFKRPCIMFRPGACFRMPAPAPFVGRAIPMNELLAPDAVAELRARDTHVVQFAFGLAVPAKLTWDDGGGRCGDA